jgi:outer membrane protein assembly factor BamB
MNADTEGFYGVTLGPEGVIYATGNTLGYGTIYRFERNGQLLGPLQAEHLRTPGNLKIGPDGLLYVIGTTWPETPARGQVLRYNARTGAFIDVFVAPENGSELPTDLAFGPDKNLYVCDFYRGVLRYDGNTGALIDNFVPTGTGGLNSASAFAFGPDGNLYVCSRDSDAVLKFNGRTGGPMRVLVPPGRGGLRSPTGMAFGRGDLYVSSSENNRVLRYNGRTGQFIGAFITTHPEVTQPGRLVFLPTGGARARR